MGSAAPKFWTGFEKMVLPAMVVAAANLVEIDSIAEEVDYLCAAASQRHRDRCCRHPAARLDSTAIMSDCPARQSQERSV